MTNQTDSVGKWEFPEDGMTPLSVVLDDDAEPFQTQIRHTTRKRTLVNVSGGTAADAFRIAAAWMDAHPNARIVAINGPHYGSSWQYMTNNLCRLDIEVSWVNPQDVENEYGETS